MKKLKILLQSNVFLVFLFFFTLFRITVVFHRPLYQKERLGEKKIVGVIQNKVVGDYNTKLTIGDTLVSSESNNFLLGQKVVCVGDVSLPNSQSNFYLFDYQKYLASKNIHYIMKGNCEVLESNISIFYQIKNKIIDIIEKRKSSSYLKAFLLGDSTAIADNVKKSYQTNGISHLFAVSGMHIGFFFLLFGKVFKKEKRKNLFLFLFLLFYLFLTNFSPSVIRASLFFFFSKALSKLGFHTIQSFLIFTMLLLCYQPYFLYHSGFLYSFTISFFLLYYSSFINQDKNDWKILFKISLLAILASIPIQIETNFSINLLSLLYNLIFVPIISQFFFPVSFLVFFFPLLDSFYYFLLSILESISLLLTQIPSTLIFCHLPFLYFFLYYSIFLFVMHKMIKKEYKYSILLLFFFFLHFYLPRFNSNGMVLMMDVGQGDSILIVYPYQKLTVLVDTGGAFYETSLVENTIVPTLHAHGISSLDYLILSHGDLDHVGEAIPLLQKVKVKKVIFNSGKDTEAEQKILSYLHKNKIAYQKLSKDTLLVKNEQFQFLNSKKEENENEDSLVLQLKIKNYTILLMGDSGTLTENYLLEEYNLPKVDILKVGHHGSKYSSSLKFLSEIHPQVCLISAGENNRYGHPHQETLNHLQFCDTYITSIDGAIKIKLGKSMRVTTVR